MSAKGHQSITRARPPEAGGGGSDQLGCKRITLISQFRWPPHGKRSVRFFSAASDEDPSLVAIAQRFKPNNGISQPSNDKDPTFVNGEPAVSLIRPSTPVPS